MVEIVSPKQMVPQTRGRCGCDPTTTSMRVVLLFFNFFWGYRGIVHPPSADEGTERTWFEPEQRPRKRVSKRSVHGKQPPQGASKISWCRDDQP